MWIIFGTGLSTNNIFCLKACKRSKVHGRSCEIKNKQKTNCDTETNNLEFEKKKKSETAENRTSKMGQITCNSMNRILNLTNLSIALALKYLNFYCFVCNKLN